MGGEPDYRYFSTLWQWVPFFLIRWFVSLWPCHTKRALNQRVVLELFDLFWAYHHQRYPNCILWNVQVMWCTHQCKKMCPLSSVLFALQLKASCKYWTKIWPCPATDMNLIAPWKSVLQSFKVQKLWDTICSLDCHLTRRSWTQALQLLNT